MEFNLFSSSMNPKKHTLKHITIKISKVKVFYKQQEKNTLCA